MVTQACPSEVLPIGRKARECRITMIKWISGHFAEIDGILSQVHDSHSEKSRWSRSCRKIRYHILSS